MQKWMRSAQLPKVWLCAWFSNHVVQIELTHFCRCLLRSLEEAKLFERALIANIEDDETRTSKLAAFESSIKDESSDSVYVTRVDVIVSITAAPVSSEVPADVESRLPSAPDGALAVGQESKRMLFAEKKSSEAIAKAEQEQEMLRRLELRAQLEEFWSQTSRFTKVSHVLLFATAQHTDWLMLSFTNYHLCRSTALGCTKTCWQS